MKKAAFVSIIGLSILALSIGSCSKNSSTTTAPTLYDSLGGTALVQDPTAATGTTIEKGRLLIRSILDSTVFVIAADTQINKYFTVLIGELTATPQITSGYEALSKNLTDFVCVGTGAKDYTYTGKTMTAAHNPATNPRISMLVDNGDFTEFETDLFAGALKNGVPASTPALMSVGRIVESLRSIVVQR